MLTLPKIIDNARAYIDAAASHRKIPLFGWDDVTSMLKFIDTQETLKNVIRSLHIIGSVVEVKWYEYDGPRQIEKIYVVGKPKWLADLLRTIVTVREGAVRNGVILKKQLVGLWSEFDCATEPLVQLMSQLDIMVALDDGDRYLIPCMLSDTIPDGLPVTCPNPLWVFRRSYLMEEGLSVPVGVMGKMIAISMRWGCVVTAWREGCVVSKNDVLYTVRRSRVRKRDTNGSFVKTDSVNILMSSRHPDTSQSQLHFVQFRQAISNVLTEFYHVPHEEVIPLDDDCTDYCTLKDVIAALHHREKDVTSYYGEKKRVDILCSDLQVESFVMKIPEESLQLGEVLGKGAYGTVVRGDLSFDPTVQAGVGAGESSSAVKSVKSVKNGGAGGENSVGGISVAVKMLSASSGEAKVLDGDDLQNILSTNWEIYLMSCIRNANVVQLYGVCVDKQPPWVVMELMEGGDLYTALTDPSRVRGKLSGFSKAFDKKYNEYMALPVSPVTMEEALNTEMDGLRRYMDRSLVTFGKVAPQLSEAFEKFWFSADQHWRLKSRQSHQEFISSRDKVIFRLTLT